MLRLRIHTVIAINTTIVAVVPLAEPVISLRRRRRRCCCRCCVASLRARCRGQDARVLMPVTLYVR